MSKGGWKDVPVDRRDPNLVARLWARLPTVVDRRVRIVAWLSLGVEILIVLTGGAVRLSDSGLGCPTWPQCEPGSFVATPEMGIHGAIEFGNRLLFFVLQLVAIIAFLFIVRMRRQRRDLFWLAIVPCFSVVLQAVLGGITVLTNLNPWVVGLHFASSVVLVAIATVFVYRVYYGPRGAGARTGPRWFSRMVATTGSFVAVTVVLGIVTTGSGPHAGDQGAARNGLDPALTQHLHSYPAYVTLALTVAVLAAAHRLQRTRPALRRTRSFAAMLLVIELVQIAVGVTQARLGLPVVLVGVHMVLACILVSAMVAVMLSLRVSRPPVDTRYPPAAAESTRRITSFGRVG